MIILNKCSVKKIIDEKVGGRELKRVKKQKQILIKREFFSSGTYDYIWKDKNEGERIIESTKELKNRNYKFVRAKKWVSVWFKLKRFFENKKHSKNNMVTNWNAHLYFRKVSI